MPGPTPLESQSFGTTTAAHTSTHPLASRYLVDRRHIIIASI